MTVLTLANVWAAIILLAVLIGAFYGIRGCYRYYRDNRPVRMATFTKPMHDHRNWQREFTRSLK